jgi:4-amino-4-deoxy-L-arabinose transferase-like glycosyltransferase
MNEWRNAQLMYWLVAGSYKVFGANEVRRTEVP